MKLLRLLHVVFVLGLSALGGWLLGCFLVHEVRFIRGWIGVNLRRDELARAQRPPPRPIGPCVIDRARFDPQAPEPLGARRAERVVQDEKPLGFRLYGIRRDSLLADFGVQNGDVLRRFDGYTPGSKGPPPLRHVSSQTHLVLEVERAGQPIYLVCALR